MPISTGAEELLIELLGRAAGVHQFLLAGFSRLHV